MIAKMQFWTLSKLNMKKNKGYMMYKVIFNQDEQNYEEFDSLEKGEEFVKRYVNAEIIQINKNIKHYKIYIKDEKGRETIRLLNSSKSYSQINKEFGKCEELFFNEYEQMKKHIRFFK